MKKIFTLIFLVSLCLGSIAQKKVAYIVMDSTRKSNITLPKDAFYRTLASNPDFIVTAVGCKTGIATNDTVTSADLVILLENVASNAAGIVELRGLNKPMLMMKPFTFNRSSGRWYWAATGKAANEPASDGSIKVASSQQSHAIFTGVTFDTENKVKILNGFPSTNKGVQGFPIDGLEGVTGGSVTTLATASTKDTLFVISEISAGTSVGTGTNTATVPQKFIEFGIHYPAQVLSANNLATNGRRILKNACYYLLDMTVPAEVKVTDISVSSEGGATTITTTGGTLQMTKSVAPTTAFDTTVTWSVNNEAIATIDATTGLLTAVANGDVIVKATANDGSTIFGEKTITVSGQKQDQIITFADLAAKTFGDATFDLTATASSGLAVSYTSSNTAVATISGSTVTIVGAGTTNITASQAGDDSYNAAADVEKTLTVAKADQTITFGALPTNKKAGDADFAPGATASSGLDVTYTSSETTVATIVSGMIHIVAAGTTTITASQAGNDNYNAANDVTQTLTVLATGILAKSVNALGVSPNPADGYIKIDNAASLKKIEVLNMQGKVVKSVSNSNSQAFIDVSDLDAGIYTIRAKSGSDVYVSKFVKK